MNIPLHEITSAAELSLRHAIKTPGVGAHGKSPLLLLLHGYGSNEQDLLALATHLDPQLFVVSARAPFSLQYGAYSWFALQFTPEGLKHDAAEARESMILLKRFIGELLQTYPVDPTRVYLGGFSQGAIMSLSIALQEPQLLAGLVLMSGRFPIDVLPADDTRIYRGLPVFVAHGLYDAVLPISDGRRIRDRLTELPVSLAYHEYPMAHEVSPESLSDLAQWLQERLTDEK